MRPRLQRLALVLLATLFVGLQLLAVPAQATTLTPGQIAAARTVRYWEMKAQASCAWIMSNPDLPTGSRPFAYRECVQQWLVLHAPGWPYVT